MTDIWSVDFGYLFGECITAENNNRNRADIVTGNEQES